VLDQSTTGSDPRPPLPDRFCCDARGPRSEGFSKINRASFRQRSSLSVQDDPVGERNVETKTRVFISYSRKDMAFADKLEAALRVRV